jgi:branched-subunit amino acid ABC-type transport system permease component
MLDAAALAQFLLSGATTGCTYALVALGIVLAANVSGVVNLAQGEYVAAGGLFLVTLLGLGLPLILCLCGVGLLGAIIGALQESLTVRPTRNSPHFIQVTVTLGVAVMIRGVAYLIYGKDPIAVPGFSGDDAFVLFDAILPVQSLWIWGGTAVLVVMTFGILNLTSIGRAIRACSINPRAARLMGIDPERMSLSVFAASGALSALGGALIGPLTLASWDSGLTIGLKGLIAAIFGGFRSPTKAVVAGLAIGIAESLVVGFGSSNARDAIVYGGLLVALLVMGGVLTRGRDRLRLGSSY